MIESSLLIQIPVAISLALIFIIIIEGFGYLVTLLINHLAHKLSPSSQISNSSVIENIFVGGIFYALTFFTIGITGYLSKSSVLIVSLLVPVLAFTISRRWHDVKKNNFLEYAPVLIGGSIFLVVTFVFWFRPITNFDGLWYHITIPKLFLQRHSTENLGSMISYSLQPSITYFWNLWPLSAPVPTVISSIVINAVSAIMFTLSLMYAAIIGKKVFRWGSIEQIAAILVLGTTYEALRLLGTGGNDLIGVAYALIATLSIFQLLHNRASDWNKFIVSLLLIVGLASTKIFFLIFAAILVAYLVIGCWDKFTSPSSTTKKGLAILAVLAITFVVTFLPWLIRSYLETGKILYPVGTPGFSEGVYRSEGGGSSVNHWTKFVFDRFYSSILPMITFVYSPIIGIGVASVLSPKFRKVVSSLWIVALFGWLAVYFASIALQWRYYLPPAILLILLGLIVIFRFTKNLDMFGKIAILGAGVFLTMFSFYRVTFSAPDTTGLPSINGNLYVSNFSGTNDYINTKLSIGTYDYVQQESPSDLRDDENIFIGNAYVKPLPIYGMMKLAYVNNPILEHTIDTDKFSDIQDVDSFLRILADNKVRYVLTHDKMTDVCKVIGIKQYSSCDSSLVFEPVLHDERWDVNWYRIRPQDSENTAR